MPGHGHRDKKGLHAAADDIHRHRHGDHHIAAAAGRHIACQIAAMIGHDDRQRYEMRNDMRLGSWHETVSVDELRCGALCQVRGTLSSDNLSGGNLTSARSNDRTGTTWPHQEISRQTLCSAALRRAKRIATATYGVDKVRRHGTVCAGAVQGLAKA